MADQGNCGTTSNCPPSPPQLQLYQTIIFATPVLFAFMLLLLFCLFYLRRRRGMNIQTQMRAQFFAGGLMATPPPEHGLSRSMRQRLPIILFDEKFAATCQDTQCAVCLGDYQPNEKLQQMPFCNHSFHAQCIDEWLAKHATCPLCRISLLEGMSQDANSMELLLRRDGNRIWEERVVNELPHVIPDFSSGASSSNATPTENANRLNNDHAAVNIDRS